MRIEPTAKRIRVYLDGVPVADTTRARLVWEHKHYPAYYIPAADVRADALVSSATVTHADGRGDACHFTVQAGDVERVDAAWQYAESPVGELRDLIRFDWAAMDAWFEEDEEVFVHPRSPYTRVDILPSSRAVRVEVDGVVLADSRRAYVLHETGLRPRWYFPRTDVRFDLLLATESATWCPYKGQAEYWTARVGDRLEPDIAWSYSTPLPESERIAGLIAFYDERVELMLDEEEAR